MHTDVDCLGRISVAPRLLAGDREDVAGLAALWVPTSQGLVLRRCADREPVVAELRAVIDVLLRPAGFRLHGIVVARTPDGEVFTVTVRRNRVASRVLWAEDDVPAPDCRVIDLDRRRRREARSRDLPAG